MKAMKTKNMFWAMLSMTAALVMTACSSDNDITETPAAPQAQKTIPYTVTVTDDATTTRATVKDDPTDRQLYFATGDKLYITGENIQGVLDLQAGDEGKASGATFSGELTYSGEGSPADDLQLTATLVSAQQTVGTQVSVDAAGAVTVNYPITAYCADVATAVQEYSRLTGTCEYSQKAFSLTQQTAFLNFVITFEDGTATGTALSAVVNNNSSDICTANVTTTTESEKVVAKFVLPVAASTTLSSANVKMGSKAAIGFGASQTLTGKVYNVKKTQYKMAAAATSADKGKLICTDGHIHAYGADAACTKARVAKIIYIGTTGHATYSHGLALAMEDVSENTLSWDNSGSNNGGKTAAEWCSAWNTSKPVKDAEWLLASQTQWNYMMGANGAGSYTALRDGFSSVGGSNLRWSEGYSYYWSSTEEGELAESYNFNGGYWSSGYKNTGGDLLVRACLAF